MALKRLVLFAILGVGLLLAMLLSLGLRQYSLYNGHKAIADQTETLLFRFTVIREQLSEELFQVEAIDLGGVSLSLEQFNSSLSAVLADRRIPDEYKLGFMQAVDLPGMVVLVRQLELRPNASELRRNLNRELRVLGERLLLFDRLVREQARRQLIGFQSMLIGALALLLAGALASMLVGYRRLVLPFLAEREDGGKESDNRRPAAAGASLLAGPVASDGVVMGIAHEVNDLANGMINYAQVLADELQDRPGQREIAAKMIATGEQLAGIMKKTIFYSRGDEEEFLPLAEVLADAVLLGRYALKSSGIQVEMDLPADFPALPVNARRMQQVFLVLFEDARRVLNLHYPAKDANKRFRIHGEIRSREQGRCLQLSLGDQMGFMATAEGEGFGRLQEIVAQQGGALKIEAASGRHPAIILEFPC